MPRPGPRTTPRYSDEFKSAAVRLSQQPGVRVCDVAQSLYIHPYMLSRWRKLARQGIIMTKGVDVDSAVAAELKALRQIKRQYDRLKVEHDLLKKRSRSLQVEGRNLRLHRAPSRDVPGEDDVPSPWRQHRRLLCVGTTAFEYPGVGGRGPGGEDPSGA